MPLSYELARMTGDGDPLLFLVLLVAGVILYRRWNKQ
jgi:hypothetical protein